MRHSMNRRAFMKTAGITAAGLTLSGCGMESFTAGRAPARKSLFKISLGEYSLHRALAAGELDHLDFAKVTREVYGIDAVEFWSAPFQGRVTRSEYLTALNKRSADLGVRNLLILVDGEGDLGNPDARQRSQVVDNHKKWLTGAAALGCHSIRVNARSEGAYDEQLRLAADGLRRLSEEAASYALNVIVENHGGFSSNGKWLAAVMEEVHMPNCGTLPDFGNFHDYDRYLGVQETMPYAKAISAKSHDFDEAGNEIHTDYLKMMRIVLTADYHGYVGIEYEGNGHSEREGILLTKALLERVRTALS